MEIDKLAQILAQNTKGRIRLAEPLSRHTTWQIGGPADLLFIPGDRHDLKIALKLAKREQIPVTFLGGGSNLLISDKGIRGLVIKLADGLNKIKICDEMVTAESGVRLTYLVRKVVENGLSGLEFASGIPGTLGGAVIMNAGAHGGCMADVIDKVLVMNYDGEIINLSKEELGFTYRNSSLKNKNCIVLECQLKLWLDDIQTIKERIEKYRKLRKEKQPLEYPNAGSVFKNPPGDSAGRLIDAIGAKGWKIGKAQVSYKHANFIVNLGGATCEDVCLLIKKVQDAVENRFGILLEPEIIILGE